jgi:hypothetical protein
MDLQARPDKNGATIGRGTCRARHPLAQAFERRTSKKAVNASHHASSVCRNRSNRRLPQHGHLMPQNRASTIYAHGSLEALLKAESASGAKSALPGAAGANGKAVTERP